MANANEITFGVEIECLIPVDALRASGWTVGAYHVGALVPGFEGWKAMQDGSVRPDNFNFAGVELVSPILRGAEGLASVRAICAKLAEMGAKVNRSCGLHVHVGFDGDAVALRRLICSVANHEKALYAVTGTRSREGNTYCKSVKESFKGMENVRSLDQVARNHYAQDRYHVLNLTNLIGGRRQTVEFRVFAGTTNATKITAYVQVCVGLVHKSLDTKSSPAWDAKPTETTSPTFRGTPGRTEVARLMRALGWLGSFKTRFGLIEDATLTSVRRELDRLATKYDANATAPVVSW